MPIDSISFAFKGTAPSLTVKGTKVNLATSTDTLKLPNGKTITGFKADDGTFFQLKKKDSGGSEIVIHGEKANLKNWNFKVKGGALSKMSLADGSRYKADNLDFAKKEKSYIFDSTFKQVDHGLSKRPPSTGGLVGEMDQEIPSTPLTAKRRKLAENVDGAKLDALLHEDETGIRKDDFKAIAHLLTEPEIDILNAFAADSTNLTKAEAAKKLIDNVAIGTRLLGSAALQAVMASVRKPSDPTLRTKALGELNRARQEGQLAKLINPPLDLRTLLDQRKTQRDVCKQIGQNKFAAFIPRVRLQQVQLLLEPAELKTLAQYVENPSGDVNAERARDLLESLNGAFDQLLGAGLEALDDHLSETGNSEKEQTAKSFLDSARQSHAIEYRSERALQENNRTLEQQGLKRVKVTGDGNCFFHACSRNISSRESDESVMLYREDLVKFVKREGAVKLAEQMENFDNWEDEPQLPETMVPMDESFLRNLGTNAKEVRNESNRAAWGNLQHARLLAASTGKPVVIIAPQEAGGSWVLNPDFSFSPLKSDGKDPVFATGTSALTRPIVLVFDGVNHWDAGVPKTD